MAEVIVQTVSGQRYSDYIQQWIFAPLAMQHAALDPAEDSARGAATGRRLEIRTVRVY